MPAPTSDRRLVVEMFFAYSLPSPHKDILGGLVRPPTPRRDRHRHHPRADDIKVERALNDDYLTERNKPPPF